MRRSAPGRDSLTSMARRRNR
ncbi:hypothetical protein XHV734_1243 [Xanthomonas hortorum pv. vitians]|nr:hypothetical protein XHV734_1243 [Xanthomonas hortorum pv. vitians]